MTISSPSVSGRLRREGVVDKKRNTGRVRDLSDLPYIEHFEAGIADGLGDHEPCAVSDGRADAGKIARFDKGGTDTEARQRMRQEIDRATIERSGSNDMVAGTQQRGDRKRHRRHAARGADRVDAVFERRQTLLQHGRRRIGNAHVDVTGAFEVEQARGVIGIVR
jgi:hypothetical protein